MPVTEYVKKIMMDMRASLCSSARLLLQLSPCTSKCEREHAFSASTDYSETACELTSQQEAQELALVQRLREVEIVLNSEIEAYSLRDDRPARSEIQLHLPESSPFFRRRSEKLPGLVNRFVSSKD